MNPSIYICAMAFLAIGSIAAQSCVENPAEMSATSFTGEMGANRCVDLVFSETPAVKFNFRLIANSIDCSKSSVKLLSARGQPIYDLCSKGFRNGVAFRIGFKIQSFRFRLDRGNAAKLNVKIEWNPARSDGPPATTQPTTRRTTQAPVPAGQTSDGCKIEQVPAGASFDYTKSAQSSDTCIQFNFGMWDSIRRTIAMKFQPAQLDCANQDITLRDMYGKVLSSMCDNGQSKSNYIYKTGYGTQFLAFRFERKQGTAMNIKGVSITVDGKQAEPQYKSTTAYRAKPASCGRASIPMSQSGLRIINGAEARPFSHPWQVKVITTNGRSIGNCGGSLINNQWVLTAAHCLSTDRSKMSVQLGAHNYKNTEDGKVSLAVERMVGHEAYDEKRIVNDIALLKLTNPVEFTEHIQPICLPEIDPQPQQSIISGWGKTSDVDGSTSDVLMQVAGAINDRSVCRKFGITEKQICFGSEGANGFKSSCQGDSGGPLTTKRADGARVLNGVTSFGSAESCYGHSVYVNVFAYLDWISQNMQ